MSRVFAAYSVGALLGPAFGAVGGVRAPFAMYLATAVAGAAAVFLMKRPAVRRRFRADRSAMRSPGFALASVGIGFAMVALGIVDGVLPLHLGSSLSQAGIAVLYVGVAVIHAAGATIAGRMEPRRALASALALVVCGVAVAGAVGSPLPWFGALAVAGVGVGIAETGSVGALLEQVPSERSVTAVVVWSQVGIVGYLVGPLAGGFVAESVGFEAVGLVPLAAAAVLVARLRSNQRATVGEGG
jgi:MFS family permease